MSNCRTRRRRQAELETKKEEEEEIGQIADQAGGD